MAEEHQATNEFRIDRSKLYREEGFTDLQVGTIKRLTPVKVDGTEDKTRKAVFVGQTNIMTPHGPVPIQGIIEARDLQQAVKKFPETMQEAMAKLVEEAKRFQEQQQQRQQIQKPDSRIIVPGR